MITFVTVDPGSGPRNQHQSTLTVKRSTLRSATDAGFWEETSCWVRAYGLLPWVVAGGPWSLCDNSLILSFRGVPMGLQPTRANENHPRRHPRESGGPFSVWNTVDSRLRGNDVTFSRAAGDEESRTGLKEPRRNTDSIRQV